MSDHRIADGTDHGGCTIGCGDIEQCVDAMCATECDGDADDHGSGGCCGRLGVIAGRGFWHADSDSECNAESYVHGINANDVFPRDCTERGLSGGDDERGSDSGRPDADGIGCGNESNDLC